MTVIRWPIERRPRPTTPARNLVVDPLPEKILHTMVADIPGPRNETEAERAARFDAQLAEVLSHKPRDAFEVMLVTQAIMMRLVAEDAHRDAVRQGRGSDMAKKFLRQAKQLDKQTAETVRLLEEFQSRARPKLDPAIFAAAGLGEFLIPDPDDPAQPEEAVSGVIVPLHPAPKMLQ